MEGEILRWLPIDNDGQGRNLASAFMPSRYRDLVSITV